MMAASSGVVEMCWNVRPWAGGGIGLYGAGGSGPASAAPTGAGAAGSGGRFRYWAVPRARARAWSLRASTAAEPLSRGAMRRAVVARRAIRAGRAAAAGLAGVAAGLAVAAAGGVAWAKAATGVASKTAAATVDRRKRVIALFSRSGIVAGCAGTAVPTLYLQLFEAFVQLGRPKRHTCAAERD